MDGLEGPSISRRWLPCCFIDVLSADRSLNALFSIAA
jgi:hypothetical protein